MEKERKATNFDYDDIYPTKTVIFSNFSQKSNEFHSRFEQLNSFLMIYEEFNDFSSNLSKSSLFDYFL